ncbi:PhzF family phenazine biosynthesis protein [Lysinibacillus sp. FSL M8-0216]|uniref:PhzF family phenazine biosynthesis protein n=1 Tax=Lysinibacillus TaxID=400634 RepID=UPI0008831D0E|nr:MULTISPECIES: PhzF family phenazine biosynthesis protein [Lysinibacillus]HAU35326.1 PhzF family phenazine biosynthesis protein [Lysinibacillus sp.]MED4669448.1 PhzF family phenazine biosynthesis protein [Lysinibacillus fusiformis]QAS56041.1 PhzF family phenazine biosynthesis protein [Lysinibacillus sphaericus]RDV34848.1 PhzF family phenazine biosynthesis protein [Lysinibacillus fusiformis]SCX40811.1 phenazine biosynthesis protein PhzF family [Lysinibacillus fusiformis]
MTKKIEFFYVDAFTTETFGGNPAGVIPNAENLTDEDMQKIANELNLSETAFLLPTSNANANYKIRYFTPTKEVDFCGHATLGTAWLMATKYNWMDKDDKIVFESNIGLIPVKWLMENNQLTRVSMTQVRPQVKSIDISPAVVADLVGIHETDLDDRFPIKIANTGVPHLMVPVKTRQAIDQAEPNLNELKKMNNDFNISTTHLFTFDTNGQFDIYTRDFCPNIGIDEDPVTGAANGALGGYLYLENILAQQERHQLMIGQGHTINRPGILYVTITPDAENAVIEVAGAAVVSIEGKIFV